MRSHFTATSGCGDISSITKNLDFCCKIFVKNFHFLGTINPFSLFQKGLKMELTMHYHYHIKFWENQLFKNDNVII